MQCNVICEMISTRSGFGWNNEEKYLTISKDVFDGLIRVSTKNFSGIDVITLIVF